MCQFFSFVSDGKKFYYFGPWQRVKHKFGWAGTYNMDSHTSIADFYGFEGEKEDTLNKWEFVDGKLIEDNKPIKQLNDKVKAWAKSLRWIKYSKILNAEPRHIGFKFPRNLYFEVAIVAPWKDKATALKGLKRELANRKRSCWTVKLHELMTWRNSPEGGEFWRRIAHRLYIGY